MSTTYEITGVGPVQPDGTTAIFTIKPLAYFATAAQVTAFGRNPVIGDQVTDNGDGTITLISNPGTIVPEHPQEDPIDDGGTPNEMALV